MSPRTVDTKTRYQGVYARHSLRCGLAQDATRCTCTPRYFGVAWDRGRSRHRKTPHFAVAIEARDARADLLDALRKGTAPQETATRLREARERFMQAAREGVALNKWRRRYRPRAVGSLESALAQLPEELLRRRLGEVRRGDVQGLVDELAARGLSGSRVRAVVNSLRALYRWAQERELAGHDPAQRVRLPVSAPKIRDRVATPAELAQLLAALDSPTPKERKAGTRRDPREALRDSVPFALAAYATARSQEIRVLDWRHVDLDVGAVELAADEEGRKPGGSWRVVPLVAPLAQILRREWLVQGRPRKGKVCPPRHRSRTGLISLDHLQERVRRRWRELGLEPIGLHEARHIAATWLDHAGVSPKVASQIMGHKTPEYRPGAARITLDRYTHVLPGELERARQLLDTFLKERQRDEAGAPRRSASRSPRDGR
jgi:integrase